MSDLATKKCVPCEGGVPPLGADKIKELLAQLDGWQIEQGYHLTRAFAFPDFVTALEFTNKVGALAEEEAHHPDIHLSYGRVKIELWTHKIKGLTESDFILAAKIDRLRG